MKIAVLDDYANAVRSLDAFQLIADHDVKVITRHIADPDALVAEIGDAEVLVPLRERTPINEALISRLPHLKLVSQNGHIPHVDLGACSRHGVLVSSSLTSKPSYAAAELTWGLIIAALRRIPQEVQALKQGRWQSTLGTGLRGRTLGIYGFGRIGKVLARYAQAFEMDVLVWGRQGSLAAAKEAGWKAAASREEFFREADVVVLTVRLNDETRAIVKLDDLRLMKQSALLVNTSRAELIEPGALATALREGCPGLAAVDVFENEPLVDAGCDLLSQPNAVCTPHLGYVERDNHEVAYGNSFRQILEYIKGTPIAVHNPEVLRNAMSDAGEGKV
ncbi:D-2-hydroxyacid dehydrogenase family protein [Variovorax sp. Root434]|uniref:D-2-hydroxyacid dehydrogenase family protein n=1 Tax=Variovorax sp. Root434 TaxID=1736536 RepID=UPI0006F530E8|nr:D-2-hydroxyacid dehydrogenase family protein [Variovorax sp. Root434]KQX31965.1 3-phosphoglycerate dehydrogenase [Variovorax sp. Root434]